MKTLFIPAKIKSEININKVHSISKKLPRNLAIAYTVQYGGLAEQLKKILSKKHKITSFVQVLGCSKPKFPKQTQAVLLITDGKFHALSLAYNSKLPVCLFDNYKLEKISEKQIKNFENKQKSAYVNFINSNKAGVLISTKPGQENLKRALELKNKVKDKDVYFFIGDDINVNEFENFGLNSWVNTACPRLDMFGNKVINMDNL